MNVDRRKIGAGKLIDIANDKARIFEDGQRRQIDAYARDEKCVSFRTVNAVDQHAAIEIKDDKPAEQEQIEAFAPGVENQAAEQQCAVTRAADIIEKQEKRQEIEDERNRAEDHFR